MDLELGRGFISPLGVDKRGLLFIFVWTLLGPISAGHLRPEKTKDPRLNK